MGFVYTIQGSDLEKILTDRNTSCYSQNDANMTGVYCPREFDGWSCIPDTLAGERAEISCPGFVQGFDADRIAYRPCLENGTWFTHPESNKHWTNYSTCVDWEDLQLRNTVNLIYKAGYSVSLIALLVSILIFYYFKSLSCTRIQIHKNLFLSLAVNNLLWLVWYKIVIDNLQFTIENKIPCKLLHVLVEYFMVATYFWMFCEGLYLYTILVVTFLPEKKVMFYLHCIGWGIPAFLVSVYTILRSLPSSVTETTPCWMDESSYSITLSVPVCISIIVNLVFLINIVRILLKKLPKSGGNTGNRMGSLPPQKTNYSSNGSSVKQKSSFRIKSMKKRTFSRTDSQETAASTGRTKKAVRATLILIPLLGMQYILIPFRPNEGNSWEHFYQVLSAIVISGQGVSVALLFCFCNGEILSAIRRKWNQNVMNKRRSWQPCSATTTISALFCCQFSRTSLMQHHHNNNQQHVPLRSYSQSQIENEAVTPPSVAFRLDSIGMPPAVSL